MLHLTTIVEPLNHSPVNHFIISSHSELNVFKKIWFIGEISNKLPNGLFGTKVYNTLSLVILFFVLPSNFIAPGVKRSRLYPFLILNVTLLSIIFTYICTDGLSISSPCFFLKYTQNNVEYLIQNTIHLVIQVHHAMLAHIF